MVFVLFLLINENVFFEKSVNLIIYFSLILISFSNSIYSINSNFTKAKNPTFQEKESKITDRKIAEFISKIGNNKSWAAFIDEGYVRIPNCESYYQFNKFPNFDISVDLILHKEYLKANFNSESVEYIYNILKKRLDNINYIVTFNQSSVGLNKFDKQFYLAKKIANRVCLYIAFSKKFKKIKIIKSAKYSDLAVYERIK